MRARNWDTLGTAQQKRYIGFGRKQGWNEQATKDYYNAGGSLKRARGKTENEYQQRVQRERAKSGTWWPLRPAQVDHLRKMGATDGDLRMAQLIPQAQIRQMISEQKRNLKEYERNAKTYTAGWSAAEWKEAHPDAPEIFYYYHGSSVWN